eukprot:3342113-Pleurochrysis_carterae.AAC.2
MGRQRLWARELRRRRVWLEDGCECGVAQAGRPGGRAERLCYFVLERGMVLRRTDASAHGVCARVMRSGACVNARALGSLPRALRAVRMCTPQQSLCERLLCSLYATVDGDNSRCK